MACSEIKKKKKTEKAQNNHWKIELRIKKGCVVLSKLNSSTKTPDLGGESHYLNRRLKIQSPLKQKVEVIIEFWIQWNKFESVYRNVVKKLTRYNEKLKKKRSRRFLPSDKWIIFYFFTQCSGFEGLHETSRRSNLRRRTQTT